MSKNGFLSFAEGNLVYLSEEIQKEFTSIIKKVKKTLELESIGEIEIQDALDFIERSVEYILTTRGGNEQDNENILIVANNFKGVLKKKLD